MLPHLSARLMLFKTIFPLERLLPDTVFGRNGEPVASPPPCICGRATCSKDPGGLWAGRLLLSSPFHRVIFTGLAFRVSGSRDLAVLAFLPFIRSAGEAPSPRLLPIIDPAASQQRPEIKSDHYMYFASVITNCNQLLRP